MQNLEGKNPIIVHEKQAKQGAEFLGGLVSEFTAKIFPVNALILDAKEFASFPAELKTSNQKIIFLGSFPESNLAEKNIYKWSFDQHGIRYGWHGSRCVVDFGKKLLTEGDFKKMIEYVENELKEYDKYSFHDKVEKGGLDLLQSVATRNIKKKWWLYIFGGTPQFIADTVVETAKGKIKNLVQMKEQQQNIAVFHFFLKHFDDFMGFKKGDDGEV